jgi:hypothetical protein
MRYKCDESVITINPFYQPEINSFDPNPKQIGKIRAQGIRWRSASHTETQQEHGTPLDATITLAADQELPTRLQDAEKPVSLAN